jgi:hypothetical protein
MPDAQCSSAASRFVSHARKADDSRATVDLSAYSLHWRQKVSEVGATNPSALGLGHHTMPTADTNAATKANIHCPKRTAAQRAADLAFIETHVIRGKTQAEIVELLAAVRPYRISRAQVAYDVAKLKALWTAGAVESLRVAVVIETRKLDAVEGELWASWEESKASETGANPAFMKQVLDVHDRRVKLMGLSAPSRHELSGPEGRAITIETREAKPIDTATKHALFMRHMARIEEDKRVAEGVKNESV